MSWEKSNWKKPAGWSLIRKRVLERDGFTCTWVDVYGSKCFNKGSDVDHIEPGRGEELSNLRALCKSHHALRSSSQGGLAAAKQRSKVKTSFLFGKGEDPRRSQ